MFDSVLVTVRTRSGDFSVDLDIPSKEPLRELDGKLLEILKTLDGRLFHGWYGVTLTDAGTNKRLLPDDTLENAEIWDGSILYVTN